MRRIISDHIKKGIDIRQAVLATLVEPMERAGLVLAESLAAKGKLLTCGNGGSSADAQHIAAELLIRFKSDHARPSLPALCVSADPCALTAAGNDFGAESIFARQIHGLGQEGDALLAITTSGNSQNIIEALSAARAKKMKTVLLTGATGGRILQNHAKLVDVAVLVPSNETAQIQEAHIMIGHIFCAIIEKKLFGLG